MKKRTKISKKYRKIAKKGRKIALLSASIYYICTVFENPGGGGHGLPLPPNGDVHEHWG